MTVGGEEIMQRVVGVLCRSLALEPHSVKPDSRLISDLGMDSLDFLDIMFSLEKEFGVPIRDADFDRVLRPDRSEAAESGEFLTDIELTQLSPFLPELRAGDDVPRRELFTYITTETLARMVRRKLEKI